MIRLTTLCSVLGGLCAIGGLIAAVLIGANSIGSGVLVAIGGVSLGLLWLVLGAILDLLTDISLSLKRGASPPPIQRLPKS